MSTHPSLDARSSGLPLRGTGVGLRPVLDLDGDRTVALHVDDGAGGPVTPDRLRRLTTVLAAAGLDALPLVVRCALGDVPRLPRPVDDRPRIALVGADGLLDHPSATTRRVEAARSRGWELGLSGVAADPASVAAVSIFEPALVLLADGVDVDGVDALAVETVRATSRLSQTNQGAVLVDCPPDRHTDASALGASLVLGAPWERVTEHPVPAGLTFELFLAPPRPSPGTGIHELAAQRYTPRRSRKPFLTALSRHLEAEAERSGPSTVVLAAFQRTRHITGPTVERYRRLTGTAALVVMAARGLASAPLPGVRSVDLPARDPLTREWVLVVLGPSHASLLSARERPDQDPALPEADREFDFVLSSDRDLAGHAARSLLTRL